MSHAKISKVKLSDCKYLKSVVLQIKMTIGYCILFSSNSYLYYAMPIETSIAVEYGNHQIAFQSR